MIDKVTAHPNRAHVIKDTLPYYARPEFNWGDKSKWINDQNAVNYWLSHRDTIIYPTDFNSKTY